MAKINYARLKSDMAEAGFEVTPGAAFLPKDIGSYVRYSKEQPFITGEVQTLAQGLYGLAYPAVLAPEVAAQVSVGIQVGNVKLWPQALNENGYIYPGLNNPATTFQVCNGEDIQVGLAIRWVQFPGPYPQAVNGEFTIPRSLDFTAYGQEFTDEPWTFLFSVACANDATLNDYDIVLSCSLDSSGVTTPVMTFTYDAGNWVSANPSGSDITDSEGIADKVSQNIQQYAFDFIKENLLPESMRAEDIPFGEYTISLVATHTESGEVTKSVIKVNVQ